MSRPNFRMILSNYSAVGRVTLINFPRFVNLWLPILGIGFPNSVFLWGQKINKPEISVTFRQSY